MAIVEKKPATAAQEYAPHYDCAFFDSIEAGSLASARAIVPLVRELIPFRSVVDVGCGRGAWLRAFKENGADVIVGYDGEYVDLQQLMIPSESFRSADLSKALDLGEIYDLAVCLEVGEHLPTKKAKALIAELCKAAPVVLFSAAIPGQGGTHHINEQWPDYWAQLFTEHGFAQLDPIRRQIFSRLDVKSWYKHNTYLYVKRTLAESVPRLQDELRSAESNTVQIISKSRLACCTSVLGLARELLPAIHRAMRRRLGI